MPSITLNLEELQKKRAEHVEAINHIDYIIKHFFNQDLQVDYAVQGSSVNSCMPLETSRMQRALNICEQYLKEGHTVYTIKEFLKLIEQKGITLSRGGLSLAFKKSESNIYFDNDTKMWKLKNQG